MPSGRRLVQHDRGLGYRFVAGADEAGRGCLAGPLVAGGVLLDLQRIGSREVRALRDLDDSKRLTEDERRALYPKVLNAAVRVTTVSFTAQTIDRDGLHVCNLAGLRSALDAVRVPGSICLSDGFAVGEFDGCDARALVGGDAMSAAIAAASIIAKVGRDRLMERYAQLYPEWRFSENVGYSTPAHRAAIVEHGITPLHRRSFASTAYTQLSL
jgi:ribonuclease HII